MVFGRYFSRLVGKFPTCRNREIESVNREILGADQGSYFLEQGSGGLGESEEAFLSRPAHRYLAAGNGFERQVCGLRSVEDGLLEPGRQKRHRDDPGDVAFRDGCCAGNLFDGCTGLHLCHPGPCQSDGA